MNQKEKVEIKSDFLQKITKEMFSEEECRKKNTLYHYTSLKVLFDILENDSFWASDARFSNDLREEKMLELEEETNVENFIICFCEEGDMLSQWRGYCNNGGASIKFDLRTTSEYSILYNDYKDSKNYRINKNLPIHTLYIDPKESKAEYVKKRVEETKATDEKKEYVSINLYDIVPYFKDKSFKEEKELRLVFSSFSGELSPCIRFRTLANGVKVPYIVVKCGDISKFCKQCDIDMDIYEDNQLRYLIENRIDIIIPEGNDQEKIFYEMEKRVEECCKKNKLRRNNIKIMCKGHLPITKITVAPQYDSNMIMQEIKSYCKTKYWLKNVEVVESEIPFIKPMK